MTDREFPVTFDPKRGALVDLPTVCPLCASHIGPSYDVHMVMAHPETRPRPDWVDTGKKKASSKKKRR